MKKNVVQQPRDENAKQTEDEMLSTIISTFFISCVVLVVTLAFLRADGVSFQNYGTFRKLVRLKLVDASAKAIADVLFDYAIKEKNECGAKRFDMTFIGIFDVHKQEDILAELIGLLLDSGMKPISIDKRKGISLVHGETFYVEYSPETM